MDSTVEVSEIYRAMCIAEEEMLAACNHINGTTGARRAALYAKFDVAHAAYEAAYARWLPVRHTFRNGALAPRAESDGIG